MPSNAFCCRESGTYFRDMARKSENAGLCVQSAGSDSPLHSRDCKFAKRYGKDCESDVHVLKSRFQNQAHKLHCACPQPLIR